MDISWVDEGWVTDVPILNMKDREILFITAQCAGMIVNPETLTYQNVNHYCYICSYSSGAPSSYTIHGASRNTNLLGIERIVTYDEVMQALRLKIKEWK